LHPWIDQLHEDSAVLPPGATALKLGVALAIGLLIGFERQWSHKDFGVRTFSLTALLGGMTAMMPQPVLIVGMVGVVMLTVLLNVRDILATQTVEGTTSAALLVTFVLGALSGEGHIFTATASAIIATWLLSLKPQFRALAVDVRPEEIRSALLLGLFGFVIWPLLPNRYIDPWELLQPREAWVTVLVVASLGFANYFLLRVYGTRGVGLTAVLGGLVNSTAAATELASTLPSAGLMSQTVVAVLLTSLAMFLRNLLLLAIFAWEAVPYAIVPLVAMTAVAGYFVWRRHRPSDEERAIDLKLSSPISLGKVLSFGGLFLLIQVLGTAAARWMGNSGLLVVSAVGGMVSSASTTAAAANLVAHGKTTALEAGTATVITSIVSTVMNLPILKRQAAAKPVFNEIVLATVLQVAVGVAAMVAQAWISMHWHRGMPG
jgi:uncharacterized membrane protein (DUF4010 family)